MTGLDFDVLNAKLRKRLEQLTRNVDPEERFRLMKRYLSHFVKLVQCGRHFEASFAEHLRHVVAYLNDRREQPIDCEVLGTIIKAICVICCVTAVPHQIVVIALHGLLEIFERISCKETLDALEFCGNHLKKLAAQLKRYGHYKIQRLLVELVYASSQAFSKTEERAEYIKQIGKALGSCWEPLLGWKSARIEEECRTFLANLQDQSRVASVFSLPVEDCQVEGIRLAKLKASNALWLDFNFRPATISFSAFVAVIRGQDRMEMTINLELAQNDVNLIEIIQGDGNIRLLKINYINICIDPEVINISKEGCLIFKLPSGYDCDRLSNEILPDVRKNSEQPLEEHLPNTSKLEGLLNVSLLESVASETVASRNTNNLDQSQRLRDNRDAIEEHQNIRCQLMDDVSTEEGSNKENEVPNVNADVRVLVEDVQRLRVFEALRDDCRRQQTRLSRSSKRDSTDQRPKQKEQQPASETSASKKRKLFVKQVEEEELNVSKDSQIQRNKFVEGKLVNTVKPMNTRDVKSVDLLQEVSRTDEADVLNVSSTTDLMSTEEFEQSIEAYLNNNGMFGIVQHKIIDKKIEKNIRKINQMVDRTTPKFFKRDPVAENPYDFNEPGDKSTKKQTKQSKTAGTSAAKGKRKSGDKTDQEFLPNKSAKNAANASRRAKNLKVVKQSTIKQETVPKPINVKSELMPSRVSLPRRKKPARIVDLDSDTDNEEANIESIIQAAVVSSGDKQGVAMDTFQDLDVSPIIVEQSVQPKVKVAKRLFAKSTPVESGKTKQKEYDTNQRSMEDNDNVPKPGRTFVIKRKRAPLAEVNSSAGIVARRDYRKNSKGNILQDIATALIDKEKAKAKTRKPSSSVSEHSVEPSISMGIPEPLPPPISRSKRPAQLSSLTKAQIKQHQSAGSDESPLPQSLEVNPSVTLEIHEEAANCSAGTGAGGKFDLDYANRNFLLKQFISNSNNNNAQVPSCTEKDANVSIISGDIRVGNAGANPPPSMEDSSDLQSIVYDDGDSNGAHSRSTFYPLIPKRKTVKNSRDVAERNKLVNAPNDVPLKRQRRSSSNSFKHVSFGKSKEQADLVAPIATSRQHETTRSIMKPAVFASRPSINPQMLDQFKDRIKQELNPSLVEMEKKIQKLDGMSRALERLSTNNLTKDITAKCDEIMTLERRLDELLDEVATMCTDSVDRSKHAIEIARKLTKYDETKREHYKERLQSGRQEIPGIVNDCVKSIWNQQVRSRLNQLEILITKLMM